MFRLIKNGQLVSNEWTVLHLAEGDTAQSVKLPVGSVLVPLSVWETRRRELIHREYEHGWALGVWLAASENPQALENNIDDFSLIAIEFDKSGGSGYLAPRLLHDHYGYKGELRAMGDVPQDSLSYLQQIGFDSIDIQVPRQAETAFFRLLEFNRVAAEVRLLAA